MTPTAKSTTANAKSTAAKRSASKQPASSKAAAPPPSLPDADRAAVDAAIEAVSTGARAWALLSLRQRQMLMRRLRATVGAVAAEWADVASTTKGLPPGHALRGEEWLSGPYAAIVALDAYADTLGALADGRSPIAGVKLGSAPGGRRRGGRAVIFRSSAGHNLRGFLPTARNRP